MTSGKKEKKKGNWDKQGWKSKQAYFAKKHENDGKQSKNGVKLTVRELQYTLKVSIKNNQF